MSAADQRQEVTALLKRLVACNTSNPPGSETQAAAVLEEYLAPAGLECERVFGDPARTNLLVRLPGRGRGPSLAFLGHLDVVPAHRDGWSVDPFAGVERGGAIWGRGTVDMKCQVAASAVALATLAREGLEPNGDLMLLLAADEEVGTAGVGASLFVRERPDVRPDYVIGEGAGERFQTSAGPLYLLACGNKATVEAVVTVRGRAADGSLLDAGRNALYEMGTLLARLRRHRSPVHVPPEVAPLIDVLAPGEEPCRDRVARARCAAGPALNQLVAALTSSVVHPTLLAADGPKNVVADQAILTVTATTLPGVTAEEFGAELRDALGEGEYDIDVTAPKGGTSSDPDTPLRGAIEDFLAEHDPEAGLVPALAYGYSDCDVMRRACGSTAYGFVPFRHANPLDTLCGKHGLDEHVRIDDLVFQTEAALAIARSVAHQTR